MIRFPYIGGGIIFAAVASVVQSQPPQMPKMPTSELPPEAPATARRWSEPRFVVQREGEPAVARWPDVAVGPAATFVVGNEIPLFNSSPLSEPSFIALKLGAGRIGRPKGRFNFVSPRAVVDQAGKLHVIWAEPEGEFQVARADMWPPRKLTSLWTASYEPESGWSDPLRLYHGKQLHWGFSRIGMGEGIEQPGVIRATDSRVCLVVSTFTSDESQFPLFLSLRRGRWVVDTIPTTDSGPSVLTSGISNDQDVSIAFLASDRRSPVRRDINSVFFQRSTDAGRTWNKSQLVWRSGINPAISVQLLSDASNRLHLLWLQSVTADSTILRHSISLDHGATWSSPVPVWHEANARNLSAVIDSRGRITAIWENAATGLDGVHLDYATWQGNWSPVANIAAGWRAFNARMTLSRLGNPFVVFEGSRSDVSIDSGQLVLFTELQP